MILTVGAILFCMFWSAFFAGMETGVISINRLRLRHLALHNAPGARTLERFLARPDRLLGTTLIGTNLFHVVISVLAANIGYRAFGTSGAAVSGVAVTVLLLVCCEYLPKAWFQSSPVARALPLAGLLEAASRILRPLSWLITRVVDTVLRTRRRDEAGTDPFLTREELLHLTLEGASSGALTKDESRMIHGVFEVAGRRCADVMVPRARMLAVDHDRTTDDLLALAREKSVSRFPVWNREQRRYTGVINIFDVLSDEHSGGRSVRDYMRPPQFVPAHAPVDHVMPRMRVARQPLMLVTDERFEVVGLVTLDDVMDEIVGYKPAAPAPAKEGPA